MRRTSPPPISLAQPQALDTLLNRIRKPTPYQCYLEFTRIQRFRQAFDGLSTLFPDIHHSYFIIY